MATCYAQETQPELLHVCIYQEKQYSVLVEMKINRHFIMAHRGLT